MKCNPFYMLKIKNGIYSTDNTISYYRHKLPDDTFSFDSSNQKVQANLDEFGTISNLTFFHHNYLMESKPGVWVGKDFVQEHDLSVSITWNGHRTELKSDNVDVISDLADNLFPRSIHHFNWGTVTLIAAAPITHDGERLSSLMYAIIIENTSDTQGEGVLELPSLYKNKYSDTRNVLIQCRETNSHKSISFTLPPHSKKEFMIALTDPNTYQDAGKLFSRSVDEWLEETRLYYKQCIGQVHFDDDPMAGYLIERAYQQASGAFAMNGHDQILGSNWGTYPVTPHIWNKDMYYSSLPYTMTEPELCKKTIHWFAQYGIKYPGTKFEGGIFHSLSNSLSVILLSGAYYDYFADRYFFLDNEDLYKQMKDILDKIITSRKRSEPHLYRSIWISDAYSLGIYHTGSNICVYRACRALSRLALDIFDEKEYAIELEEEANAIKNDIEKYMTVETNGHRIFLEGISSLDPDTKEHMLDACYRQEMLDQGLQFLTDVDKNGVITLRMHDGEESDTTLLKYYGYEAGDRTTCYGKFSSSDENPTYSSLSRGIKWGNQSGATFPGYISILNGAGNVESWSGEHGRFKELERLADLDGSWWWWPYKVGAPTGDVTRMNSCGKCGWASGIFYVLFITEFLGINYDAPTQHFTINPKEFIGNFYWEDFHIGDARFDIRVSDHHIYITNKNNYSITVNQHAVEEGEEYEFTK